MTTLNRDTIEKRIGKVVYSRLEKIADNEVSISLKMQLIDENRNKNYYTLRLATGDLLDEYKLFDDLGLKFTPFDVVNVLFRCKMLFAVDDEEEYSQRVGGGSYVDEIKFIVRWQDKSKGVDTVIDQYFGRLDEFINPKTLIVQIDNFYPNNSAIQSFFDALFEKLGFSFVCFVNDKQLKKKHKNVEPGLRKYTLKNSKQFFSFPSIGYTTFGSEDYVFWYSMSWLRTLLNMVRIAYFISPPQIDFGVSAIKISAPLTPVFLGDYSTGCFCWDEDAKSPWERIPDGSFLLSFGYKGVTKMWLDVRVFSRIENFLIENRRIFDCIKNPWKKQSLYDVAPSLDILSAATQVQDLGAKILLIYCCLEHLFVPIDVRKDNKKYIVGGINALKPELLPWFNQLYELRCSYAHKGYVLKSDKVRGLVFESMKNTVSLLGAKLS